VDQSGARLPWSPVDVDRPIANAGRSRAAPTIWTGGMAPGRGRNALDDRTFGGHRI